MGEKNEGLIIQEASNCKGIKLIGKLFSNLLNKRIRDVKLGVGSFVTMGFGDDLNSEMMIRRKKEIHTRPEWYLWIYMCEWELKRKDTLLTWNEDEGEFMKEELSKLEDKSLLKFEVLNQYYDIRLEFEDSIVLELFADKADDSYEQWHLFTPDRKVFTAGPLQQFSYDQE